MPEIPSQGYLGLVPPTHINVIGETPAKAPGLASTHREPNISSLNG
jgi:hypothetical protein